MCDNCPAEHTARIFAFDPTGKHLIAAGRSAHSVPSRYNYGKIGALAWLTGMSIAHPVLEAFVQLPEIASDSEEKQR
jgi:hypothetical protein